MIVRASNYLPLSVRDFYSQDDMGDIVGRIEIGGTPQKIAIIFNDGEVHLWTQNGERWVQADSDIEEVMDAMGAAITKPDVGYRCRAVIPQPIVRSFGGKVGCDARIEAVVKVRGGHQNQIVLHWSNEELAELWVYRRGWQRLRAVNVPDYLNDLAGVAV